MLVKVKNKDTGLEQFITPKAYNLAKKRYVLLGNAAEGSDLYNPNGTQESTPVQETIPNQKTTVQKEESGADPVVVNQVPKIPAKRGPKPKNQISSPAPAVEV